MNSINNIKNVYHSVLGKGDMDYILESVPFTNCEDEPRLHTIIAKLIEQKDVPEYEAFTKEDSKKKMRRKRKVRKLSRLFRRRVSIRLICAANENDFIKIMYYFFKGKDTFQLSS